MPGGAGVGVVDWMGGVEGELELSSGDIETVSGSTVEAFFLFRMPPTAVSSVGQVPRALKYSTAWRAAS